MICCENIVDVAFLFNSFEILGFKFFHLFIKIDFYYDWGSINVIPKS